MNKEFIKEIKLAKQSSEQFLKENPSKQYASYIRCKGYKGIFEEDGGSYKTEGFYSMLYPSLRKASRGWVRFKLEKTPAQKEGLRIAQEYCPKRDAINWVHIDEEFNNWETW